MDETEDAEEEAEGKRPKAPESLHDLIKGPRKRRNSVATAAGDDGLDDIEIASVDEKALEEQWRKRREAERDEINFPDEVNLDPSESARKRFAKYRGLKSFRASYWDPKENLPVEYSQIYQFQDAEATRKAAIEFACEGTVIGDAPTPITVELADVPVSVAKAICMGEAPVLMWPLLQYERKVSVLHYVVRRHKEEDTDPVKCKDPMIIHCGFRRFPARPIYTQHTQNANKFLVERYFLQDRFSVASCYARVMYPPAPVLMFRADPKDHTKHLVNEEGQMPLVASGTLHSIDPDRMLIKRAILTGHPFQVNKRAAVVKFMFYNPDDIRWFRPVELWTKYGLKGHIKEPRGTKGLMKCVFDDFIKNNDTVCMSLYKRQFPPFDASAFAGHL